MFLVLVDKSAFTTFALGCPTWGLLGDAQCSREAVLGSAGAHRVPETLIGPPGTEQDTAASRHLPALNGGAFDSSCAYLASAANTAERLFIFRSS